jgi:hypothetical protein
MSLLHQDTPEDIDVVARGEELTKGSSHLIWTTMVAAILVSVAIAIYVIAGQKPPAVVGDVVAVWVHPQHSENSGFDTNGEPMPKETFNQVLVFAEVRLHNQSKLPLYLVTVMTNATVDDGIHSSYAASRSDGSSGSPRCGTAYRLESQSRAVRGWNLCLIVSADQAAVGRAQES